MKRWLPVLLVCAAYVAAQEPAATGRSQVDSKNTAVGTEIQSAEAALAKQDYASAVITLKELAAKRPDDAQVAYDLGFAEERVGDDTGAVTAYKRASTLAPEMAEPSIALGLLDARAGRAQQAHAELRAAASIGSASPELRGRALRALAALDETSDPGASTDELLEAVRLTKETPDDVALSARLAARSGDTADAETAYRRTLAAEPGNVAAAAALAQLLAKSGKSAEAETLLLDALKVHPNDPELVTALAAVYGQSGRASDAVALLQKTRAANPTFAANPPATRMLARLEAMAGQDAEAAQLYSGLIASNRQDAVLLDESGGALVKIGQFPEAQQLFTRAVAMRESFPSPQDWAEAESHLAFAASRNHDPKTALQALALRATVLPNSPSSLFLQAISYDALHQNREAVKAYREFLGVAKGQFPDQEFQARHRLVALEHMK